MIDGTYLCIVHIRYHTHTSAYIRVRGAYKVDARRRCGPYRCVGGGCGCGGGRVRRCLSTVRICEQQNGRAGSAARVSTARAASPGDWGSPGAWTNASAVADDPRTAVPSPLRYSLSPRSVLHSPLRYAFTPTASHRRGRGERPVRGPNEAPRWRLTVRDARDFFFHRSFFEFPFSYPGLATRGPDEEFAWKFHAE